ncbi:MAG: hypothetical protein PHU85_01960 [Phycisphaerae bacterium]|nr:hypothetical protein [Phycisphaerae bacterium]
MIDLTELRRLYAAATEGTWEVGGPWPEVTVIVMVDGGCGGECPEPPLYEPVCVVYDCVDDYNTSPPEQAVADATFISAARAAVPELCDEVERLRAVVATLPQTADGVPIEVGMSVYSTSCGLGTVRSIHDRWAVVRQQNGDFEREFQLLYSTRAAAEAARNERSE